MFPFQQSCEFSFQVSGNIEEDQIMVDAAATSSPAKVTVDCKRKRGVEGGNCTGGGGLPRGGVEETTKKMQHRVIEKQRRVAMAGFLNTLRSLLPLEFVKGKRSVSDHVAETTNFIKHLQKNIKELGDKRERLKSFMEEESNNNIPCSVAITITNIGLDVQLSFGNNQPAFRLSDPLRVLLDEGVSVICSVSTKVEGVFHHKIQCQIRHI
ncbi:hypothetical protein V2J09_001846 [Rumex salicifolius]